MDDFFTYKNTTIRYRTSGKGAAVVLLHGFLGDLTMWDAIKTILSKKNKVIIIDLLGHGKSGNFGYIHTMETQAEMVNAVLNHLRLRKYTFIGHSMGGYVSLAFSELFPDSIKGLCLMNSTAVADTDEKKKNRDRTIAVVKKNHEMFIKMSIPNLFAEKNRPIYKEKISNLIDDAIRLSVQGIVASLEGMKMRKNRTEILRLGSFKKMVILGKKDTLLPAETIKNQIKNTDVKLITFPDGHMSHIENKNELIKTLTNFIKSCN